MKRSKWTRLWSLCDWLFQGKKLTLLKLTQNKHLAVSQLAAATVSAHIMWATPVISWHTDLLIIVIRAKDISFFLQVIIIWNIEPHHLSVEQDKYTELSAAVPEVTIIAINK